jgi:cation diffusion facilitator CzcD-associated flavoprotein CzcO
VSVEHFDVLIVGAGLSGIGAGYYLQTLCKGKRYAILEGRSDLGGTWDLFRYPGIRSDSDMFTLGYGFRPWKENKAIASGATILNYLRETAQENGIDRRIRFQHRVLSATWSSSEARWTVECRLGAAEETSDPKLVRYTCSFLYLCSGYYDYEAGYTPAFRGTEDFQGPIIHPQKWPADLDCRNKRVVVIGSGATAVTMAPALAETAAHVTMLQRSPTYIVGLPSHDPVAKLARKVFPPKVVHHLVRWKNVLLGLTVYNLCQRRPEMMKKLFRSLLRRELPADFDIATHFSPRYNPWDQRVCAAPDSDLFRAIKDGRVSIVTDQIKTFTRQGIQLESGQELAADIIVTATGLKLLALGGIRLSVDGQPIEIGQTLSYKGLMLSDVPNCAICVGYSNASWTLRADLSSMFVCRLLNFMTKRGYRKCTPRFKGTSAEVQPLLSLKAGYIERGVDQFPKQGRKVPWVVRQNYLFDLLTLHFGKVNDGALKFSREGRAPVAPVEKVQTTQNHNSSVASS